MTWRVSETSGYHAGGLDSLGWEMTVCNALEREDGPCRKILSHNASYGKQLLRFLSLAIPIDSVRRVLEVGGGYGSLMRDFLGERPQTRATMLDISPFLLDRQKRALAGQRAEFVLGDFFGVSDEFLRGFDLAVFNENMGDFPTICGLTREMLFSAETAPHCAISEARIFYERYALHIPEGEFNFNIGAARAVENVCAARIPFIFLGEHSCEARVPDVCADIVHVSAPGNPERIALRGHDEYTIRFSDLSAIAVCLGYEVRRGAFADYLPFTMSPQIRFAFTSMSSRDDHEELRHFVEDLFKYEYLLLRRKDPVSGPLLRG